jgi:hypothetical protein
MKCRKENFNENGRRSAFYRNNDEDSIQNRVCKNAIFPAATSVASILPFG